MTKAHKFKKAGLGKAPFKFDHYEKRVFQACQGAPVQAGGSCDYCGSPIMHWFWVQDANGKLFKVGSECVYKTGDKGMTGAVKSIVAKVKKEARKEVEQIRIEEARKNIIRVKAKLEKDPHPSRYMAEQGRTQYDYCFWLLHNAGHSRQFHTAKIVEHLLST